MGSEATVNVKVQPELSAEFVALLGTATEDTLEKIDAGAQLVYALYHLPADTFRQVLDITPPHMSRAIARAQAAYGVNRRRPKNRVEPVDGADDIDPIRYTETEETDGA